MVKFRLRNPDFQVSVPLRRRRMVRHCQTNSLAPLDATWIFSVAPPGTGSSPLQQRLLLPCCSKLEPTPPG